MAAGLSLAQLARKDVSRTFLHFVEHGRSRPSREVLEMIAERTGKPVAFFTRGVPATDASPGIATEFAGLAAKVRRMANGARLTAPEREALRLLEVTLRQGAALSRAIESRDGRGARGKAVPEES